MDQDGLQKRFSFRSFKVSEAMIFVFERQQLTPQAGLSHPNSNVNSVANAQQGNQYRRGVFKVETQFTTGYSINSKYE